MPRREERLRREANQRRREAEAQRLIAAEVPPEKATTPVPEEQPMESMVPGDDALDDALTPEDLVPPDEEMVPDVPVAEAPAAALHDLVQGLTPEQIALLGKILASRSAPAPPTPPPAAHPRDGGPLWWARFAIPGLQYLTYRGTNYDRGQILTLVGGPRDEQLERMGYVQRAAPEEVRLMAQCGVCGNWFLSEQFRDSHGRLRHSERFATDLDIGGGMQGPHGGAALRDVTGDAEERRMQQQYPLYLERTKATLESGA